MAAIALVRQSTRYLDKGVTAADMASVSPKEIDKLDTHYESRLVANMTATLDQSAIQLYTSLVSSFLPIPIDRQPFLVNDLQTDQFVSHNMTTVACWLYYRFGFYMAPLTATMSTINYCQFEDKEIIDDTNGQPNSEYNSKISSEPNGAHRTNGAD